ncbi:hypothetical protein ElyMa_003515000, partial [Elysia marginata]
NEVSLLAGTNITVLSIGIGTNVDVAELTLIASKPSLVFKVGDFQALKAIQTELVTDICKDQATTPVVSTPVPATKPPSPVPVIPKDTICTVNEAIFNEDIAAVVINCETKRIYPQAVCKFYRQTDGGRPVAIRARPRYQHTKEGSAFSSNCGVTVPLSELRAGANAFTIYVYPNVTDGMKLVNATTPTKTVMLAFPVVSHICPPSLVDDYLCGKPTRCNCTIVSQGRPKGRALWYQNGIDEQRGPLVVTYDSRKPDIMYTCEGRSDLGRSFGSTLKVGMSVQLNE